MGLYRWSAAASAYLNMGTGELYSPTEAAPIVAGANYPGTSNYPVPETNAMFVALSGNNANPGTLEAPKQTLQAAMSAAPSGSTIVMRAGRYKESISTPTGKTLTVQSYPMEEVWLDGSAVYSTWTDNGNGTWTTPYSVTLTRFAAGDAYKGDDPYRNHPDQVWVDGAPLQQTADNTVPAAGQFSVNQTADTLTIGVNPAGKTVQVSELPTALTVTAPITLRGFGVTCYSPQAIEGLNSMVFFGGTSHGSVLENMYFSNSAMASISVTKNDIIISNCTVQDNGHSGIMGTQCNNLLIENTVVRRMNGGQWQAEPTTAGIKLTRCDNVRVRYNHISQCPKAYGVWFDVSCTRTFVYGNTVDGGGTMMNALEIELSDGGYYEGVQHYSIVASNRLTGASGKSAAAGVLLFDTGYVKVWNNDLTGNGIPLYLWQDERINTGQANNLTFEICPWRTRGISAANNIHSSGVGANIQFAAYAQTGNYGLLGANMFDRLAGTWFQPAPPGSMTQLGRSDGTRVSYNSPSALAAAGSEVGTIAGKLGTNYQGASAPANTIADPLPADIAALLGVSPGLQAVGPVTPPVQVRN